MKFYGRLDPGIPNKKNTQNQDFLSVLIKESTEKVFRQNLVRQ